VVRENCPENAEKIAIGDTDSMRWQIFLRGDDPLDRHTRAVVLTTMFSFNRITTIALRCKCDDESRWPYSVLDHGGLREAGHHWRNVR